MAITKTSVLVLASVSVPVGGTKAAPQAQGTGASINCTTYYGGVLTYKITNGASPPTVPLTITFQTSDDQVDWYDYFTISSDTVASSIQSRTINLERGVMYLRIIGYGNTVNSVTLESYLQAVTAV